MTRKNPRHPFAGEEITGLPEGMAFFHPAQERLPELGSDWCVINIQIEHFKYFTDWFGLEASRDLLSRIGEMIRSAALQAGGMPGQPGLEEFCLIVPYDEDWIHGLFEELQSLIASVSRLDGFSPVFGVAHFDGSSTEIMEYYNRAALAARFALPTAKSSGPNPWPAGNAGTAASSRRRSSSRSWKNTVW